MTKVAMVTTAITMATTITITMGTNIVMTTILLSRCQYRKPVKTETVHAHPLPYHATVRSRADLCTTLEFAEFPSMSCDVTWAIKHASKYPAASRLEGLASSTMKCGLNWLSGASSR